MPLRPTSSPDALVNRIFVRVALTLGLLALTGLTGCVTETLNAAGDEIAESRLVVTRTGTDVTLSWISRPGATYTVLYASNRNPGTPWMPVPGAESVRGTGETMTFTDFVPEHQVRYYRLQVQAYSSR